MKRTALLFLSLRIFVGHICKPLSIITIMQDFGHTCCCQPTVVSEMIESTAERIFLIIIIIIIDYKEKKNILKTKIDFQ